MVPQGPLLRLIESRRDSDLMNDGSDDWNDRNDIQSLASTYSSYTREYNSGCAVENNSWPEVTSDNQLLVLVWQ